MIVQKVIKTTEVTELDITGITLLSKEEYNEYRNHIPPRNFWWWLRSPYTGSGGSAGCVDDDGDVYDYTVDDTYVGVSPALICNFESANLIIGDEFKLKGHTWTVISDKYALCNGNIGFRCFREDWKADDANVYETSDVKKFIEKWWSEGKAVLD